MSKIPGTRTAFGLHPLQGVIRSLGRLIMDSDNAASFRYTRSIRIANLPEFPDRYANQRRLPLCRAPRLPERIGPEDRRTPGNREKKSARWKLRTLHLHHVRNEGEAPFRYALAEQARVRRPNIIKVLSSGNIPKLFSCVGVRVPHESLWAV